MIDPAYAALKLCPLASDATVLRAAVSAIHPVLLRERSFRFARKRFYRQILDAHREVQSATSTVGRDRRKPIVSSS